MGEVLQRVCLKCEGTGVLRTYINHAGDCKKQHCDACHGTGKEGSEEVAKLITRVKAIAASFEHDEIAMQRFPGLPEVLREVAALC